ncbi:MAG: amino acid adenylation domain-containing protein [Legionellaceae bacterium]|nr:amino acid adenylation domain-containing protein [Legionellaceae bacterium]
MINITSTFTADVMHPYLGSLLKKFCEHEVTFFYNQLFQQMLLPNSEFHQNKQGINVIVMRLSDLFTHQKKSCSKKTEEQFDELIHAFSNIQKVTHVPLLVLITPSLSTLQNEEIYYLNLEKKLQLGIHAFKSLTLLTSADILKQSNTKLVFDSFTEKYGHIPYTLNFYHALATTIARKYSLLTRKPHKVIVLDCDGTLWGGVVEEDGVEGIVVDNHYSAIHEFMITCYEAGFLICLCSKNSEASVLSAFKYHKGIQLNIEEHICTYRINWQPKSSNIKSIAKELDLGLDSFIFIDDNAIECAEVKAQIPEALVIELPRAKQDRLLYLNNIWAFDLMKKGREDENRTEFYQKNKLRHQLKSESLSYFQFLKNLKIKTSMRRAKLDDYDRVFQLSQRTNQFNISPNAMTAIEFNNSIQSGSPHCLVIKVTDKFGDYGLVGVVVYECKKTELEVPSFFLSCRILGRGVECDIVKHLATVAEKKGIQTIKIPFTKTERNIPAMEFLKKLSGSESLGDKGEITLSIEDVNKNTLDFFEPEYNQKVDVAPQKIVVKPSSDFMLNIANDCLKNMKKKDKSNTQTLAVAKKNTFQSILINLLELFKRHKISLVKPNISFISLGLDSLRSVLVASEIFQMYHVEINPFELLKKELTLHELTKQLLDKIERIQDTSHKIHSNSDSVNIPLSNAQKRLWYDEKIADKTSKNNMFVAYEIAAHINAAIIEHAFFTLIERHDVLRFSFEELNDQPYIRLHSTADIVFKIARFTNPSESELRRIIDHCQHEPFDLTHPPLLRVSLITWQQKTILLLGIHHIVHDGWSLHLLLNDLSVLYEAYSKRVKPYLPASSSYVDFIYWQKNHLSNELFLNQKQFWQKRIHLLPKLELIYDNPRNENSQFPKNKRIKFKLDVVTTRQLKKLSVHHHVTLYDLLISAFGLLLSHYTNQNDVSFITAASGRQHVHAGNTMGFFVNLVLLRFQIDSNATFLDLLKTNKKIMADIFANQDLPLHDILQLTGEAVSSKNHAFSQAGFIFQNYPIPRLILNNKRANRVYSDDNADILYDSCQECRFGNLVCFMQELGPNLHGLFEYNALLFNETTIRHIMSAFKTLLKHVVNQLQDPVMDIKLLTDKQINKLFNQWNSPTITYRDSENLVTYFSEQVAKNPTAIAIKHNNNTLTYLELDRRSNQLARQLISDGVTREASVGIYLEKSSDHMVAILSVIKAGGCYVPLERDMPKERINYILKDAGVSHVITDTEMMSHLKQDINTTVNITNILDNSTQNKSTLPLINLTTPNQLAYVMYTSGSTGAPKGVMIEQRGIIRLVKATNYIKIGSDDCIAQASNLLFDAATFEIWGSLLNGATLVVVDKHTLLDPAAFAQFLKRENISILFLTTQLFHSYAFSTPTLFQNINYLVVGGEAVLADAVNNIFNQKNHPHIFINGYGPTENTTFSTAYLIKNSKQIVFPIPIGKPILGTQAYVLGRNLNPMPIGAPGKLFLGGVGLARKYINHDKLNCEKFIRNANERLYNTGDIVTWQADGNLRYIGREDNQIKINGYRIELNEIEAQLEIYPFVDQAIVLVKNNKQHHRQLAAYILLKDNQFLSEVNLYHHLKHTLPKYMLPSFYYQIDHVPITKTGKVDKQKLLSVDVEPITYTEYESSSSLLQDTIISIFAEILHIDQNCIGVGSEFFDLGGDSISALSLIHKLNHQFHIQINFSLLYEHASVKALSEQISHLLSEIHFSSVTDHARLYEQSLKTIKLGSKDKMPIIFVHPIGGTGFCYLDLIKLLPEDQPCYVIQDPSIDANQILFDDIRSMATYYNHLLLKRLHSKTFILAGYSFGGMLALEMVAQLEQKKLADHVDCIVSFDTWVVSNLLNKKAKETLKASIMQQYERVAVNLTNENIDPQQWMELYYCRLQDLGFDYIPPHINKKIILFKAMQQADEFAAMQDVTNYLSMHTRKSVEVHMVSGNHDSILQLPHVKLISNILTNYLKDTET